MDYYGYSYDEGFEAGRRQAKVDRAMAKAAGEMGNATGSVFGLLLIVLYYLTVCSGSLILSFYLVNEYNLADGHSFNYRALMVVGMAFGLNSILFLIKGILVSLRARRNMLWMVFWCLLFFVICVIPVVTIQRLIAHWFDSANMKTLAWLPAIFAGFMIYSKYRLTDDYAPRFMKWIYSIGKAIV